MSSVRYFSYLCCNINWGPTQAHHSQAGPHTKSQCHSTVESWASWTVIINDKRVNGGGLLRRYLWAEQKGTSGDQGSCVHGATNKSVRKTEVPKQVLESAHSYRVSCGQKPRSRIPYKAIGDHTSVECSVVFESRNHTLNTLQWQQSLQGGDTCVC